MEDIIRYSITKKEYYHWLSFKFTLGKSAFTLFNVEWIEVCINIFCFFEGKTPHYEK